MDVNHTRGNELRQSSSSELIKSLQPNAAQVTQRGPELAKSLPSFYAHRFDSEGTPLINWGGMPRRLNRANLHFMVAGVPGSGKTLCFKILAQSVFGTDQPKLPGNDRAIFYDPKQEFFCTLRGIGVNASDIRILNPFDERCHAWDIASDYQSSAEAFQLAKTIIPCKDNHSQPFFPKAAATVLTAVIVKHMKLNPGEWDLADLIQTCLNLEILKKFLTSDEWDPYLTMALGVLGGGETGNNVFAELTSHLFQYAAIAARWRVARRRKRQVSIKEFIDSKNTIILLGANQTFSESLGVINQLLLKRVSEQVLDHTDDSQWRAMNRTWLFLDELRELGKVPGLGDLINKGRSRGVCAVIGFQDYGGLKGAFGEDFAHELTASCAHKLFLRLSGESAEWASKCIGKAEIRETHFSFSASSGTSTNFGNQIQEGTTITSGVAGSSVGPNSWSTSDSSQRSKGLSQGLGLNSNHSVSTSTQTRETDVVLASEIAHLPNFDDGEGLSGYTVEYSSAGKSVVHRLKVDKALILRVRDSNDPGFVSVKSLQEQDLGFVLKNYR